ncbi:MAG: MobF family relaxase [Acidiferrobacterales bacterium]
MIGKPIHLKVGKGHTSAGAAGDVARYCEHSSEPRAAGGMGAAGYYPARSAPSRWIGRGAAELGLVGAVQHEDFVSALQGHLPNGIDLSRRGNRQADRRMGTDITISAPKSFSMLVTSGADARLYGLWEEAVTEAARVCENEVVTARRGKGGTQVEHTGVMLAAAFRHEDARPVGGKVSPDLHTHMVVLNATKRSDGQWVARDLDFGERNTTRVLMDFAMKAHLAKRLQELGYDIRRTQDGFEIEDISRESIEKASPRSGLIEGELERRGKSRETSTEAERGAINLATREAKGTLTRDEQVWEWRKNARETWGVDLDSLARQAHGREAAGIAPVADLSEEAVKAGIRSVSERETVMSRQDVRLQALRAGMGNVVLDTVDSAIDAQVGGLLDGGQDRQGHARYTTRSALYREQEILARTRAGQEQVHALMTEQEAQAFIARFESEEHARNARFSRFSDGQRAALHLALTSRDRVSGALGYSGAGKTTAMRALSQAYQESGYTVIGLAPTTRAERELRKSQADEVRTMQSYLASSKEPDPSEKRYFILDEAGMVGGADMDALLKKIEAEDGVMLEIGDYRQTQAVGAGTPFEQQCLSGAMRHEAIKEIYRQKSNPELLRTVQLFAEGKSPEGAEAARQFITTVEVPKSSNGQDKQSAIAQAVAARYVSMAPDERSKTLIVSTTNALRQEINASVRAGLRKRGEVAQDAVEITALRDTRMTQDERARPESYEPGQVVRLTEGRGRIRTVTDYAVAGVRGNRVVLRDTQGNEKAWNPATADHRSFQVFASGKLDLTHGDRVMFRSIDRERGIANGDGATIIRADNNGIIAQLSDGREVDIDPRSNHAIEHGWARTVHDVQGAEDYRVLGCGEGANANLFYVTLSRATHEAEYFTSNADRLVERVERFAERTSAMEVRLPERQIQSLGRLAELRKEAADELGRAGDLAVAREQQRQSIQHQAPQAQAEAAPAPVPVKRREQERERDHGR